MHFRNHLGNPVISIIDSSQGIDICGLLRDHCGYGEACEDLHDAMENSINDRRVVGGTEEGNEEDY